MTEQNNQNIAVDTNMTINEAEVMALTDGDIATYLAVLVKQRNDAHDRESVLKTKVINGQHRHNMLLQALQKATSELGDKEKAIQGLNDTIDNLKAQIVNLTPTTPVDTQPTQTDPTSTPVDNSLVVEQNTTQPH